MSIDQSVFLSLLSMDSYNRRYGQNIRGLPNAGAIGTARIAADSVDILGLNSTTTGFYAIAYAWNGNKVISYRGTDFGAVENAARDVLNGWSMFTGVGPDRQIAFPGNEDDDSSAELAA